MHQIRIAIVDDHAPFRNVLRGILEREHDFNVVAEAENGISAVEVVDDKRPSVVLMDINMPQMDGIAATRIITAKHPETKVIVLSMLTDDHVKILAQEAGASHFLSKGCNPNAIISVIRDVHQGR